MKKLIFNALLMCLPIFLVAQQDTEVGLLLGGANYLGDVSSNKDFTFEQTQAGVGLYARRHLNRHFSLRGTFFYAQLEGDDLNFIDEDAYRANRAFNFTTPVYEFSFTPEWHPFGNTIQRTNVRPYLFAGIGAVFTNPKTNLAEKDANAVELEPGHYSTSHFSFPFGGGVNFDLSEKMTLGLEASAHFPLTDYLDGISESANPGKDDWFFFGGVTLGYKIGEIIPEIVDTDGDGLKDDVDLCPLLVGTIQGCPDADSDGIADTKDDCPSLPGPEAFNGCPDTDADGIADKNDKCPDVSGLAALNGCPDMDADGIADVDDKCPDLAGSLTGKGCPDDTDGDGVYDITDDCPTIAGILNGCPDVDKDGIADRNDKCPDVAGISSMGGCPDSDGDGIVDAEDNCPKSAGLASNNGCPTSETTEPATVTDVLVSKGEEGTNVEVIASTSRSINYLVEDVYFHQTRAKIFEEEFSKLDKVVRLMKDNPNYNLKIKGHTDDSGDVKLNDHLSMRRARRCYKYLAAKGISLSRMTFEGFGASEPKSDNSTDEGKKLNRRVEFAFLKEFESPW